MDAKVLMTRNRHLALQLLRGERSVFLIRFADAAELECSFESCSKIDNEFSVANTLSPQKLAAMFQRSTFQRSAFIAALLTKLINEKGFHIMDVKKATMKELVDAYNVKASKPVKRFADRATAEKRVLAVLNGEPQPVVEEKAAAPIITTTSEENDMAKATKKTSKSKTTKATKPANATKTKAEKKVAASRSEATANSWANKRVAKDRSVKNKVTVDGKEYNSVLDAFKKLKLPVGKHIRFRGELKAAGNKVFEGHKFRIVPQGE